MNLQTRIDIEQKICRKVIADALATGYSLSVHDGEDITVRRSSDAAEIFGALMTTDEDRLYFHLPDNETGQNGMVYFVYGNDGFDVICDYSIKLETQLAGAQALAEQLERRHG